MHYSAQFEMKEADAQRTFIRARVFANVIITGADGPLAAHVPLILLPCGDGWRLEGHVARPNPFGDAADGAQALAIFNGGDAYVSAGFYPSKQQHGKVVPTWNYQAVHATGPIQTFSDKDTLIAHISRLTHFLEAGENTPWAVADAPADYIDRMTRSIVGFSLKIETLKGVEKLSQNKSTPDQLGVIDGLAQRDIPLEQPILDGMRKNTSA